MQLHCVITLVKFACVHDSVVTLVAYVCAHSWHLYAVLMKKKKKSERKNAFRKSENTLK
jgi:hypothetical protein